MQPEPLPKQKQMKPVKDAQGGNCDIISTSGSIYCSVSLHIKKSFAAVFMSNSRVDHEKSWKWMRGDIRMHRNG